MDELSENMDELSKNKIMEIIEKIENKNFMKLKPIGEGSYGKVYNYNDLIAVKEINIENNEEDIEREIEILKFIKKSNCSKYFLCYRGSLRLNDKYYILTNYKNKNIYISLYNTIINKRYKLNIKKIIENIYTAIKELHNIGVAHLDIHSGNILVNTQTNEITIIDFGASCNAIIIESNDNKVLCPTIENKKLFIPPKDLRFFKAYFNNNDDDINFEMYKDADLWNLGNIISFINIQNENIFYVNMYNQIELVNFIDRNLTNYKKIQTNIKHHTQTADKFYKESINDKLYSLWVYENIYVQNMFENKSVINKKNEMNDYENRINNFLNVLNSSILPKNIRDFFIKPEFNIGDVIFIDNTAIHDKKNEILKIHNKDNTKFYLTDYFNTDNNNIKYYSLKYINNFAKKMENINIKDNEIDYKYDYFYFDKDNNLKKFNNLQSISYNEDNNTYTIITRNQNGPPNNVDIDLDPNRIFKIKKKDDNAGGRKLKKKSRRKRYNRKIRKSKSSRRRN